MHLMCSNSDNTWVMNFSKVLHFAKHCNTVTLKYTDSLCGVMQQGDVMNHNQPQFYSNLNAIPVSKENPLQCVQGGLHATIHYST